jgi:hypothetical protein
MPRLCQFSDLHDGHVVFVNPTTVRYVTPTHGVPGTMIHFDENHRIEIRGAVEQTAQALDDAARS